MKRSRNFTIAMGGICLALTVIFLMASSMVPGVELTLMLIASAFTVVMVIETGPAGGLLLFAGASILAFVLLPNKLALLPYVCLFGYYGLVKYYVEKLHGAFAQMGVKAAFFAAVLALALFVTDGLLLGNISAPDFPSGIIFAGGIAMLLVYDLILTYIIGFYLRRIRGEQDSDSIKLS